MTRLRKVISRIVFTGSLLCWSTLPAFADTGAGTVTLVPASNSLTGQVPIGGAFTFQVPAQGQSQDDVTGTLEVWPARITNGCNGPFSGSDFRQHYKLALLFNVSNKMLQASVPQLQNGERFCFYVTRQVVISNTKAQLLSKALAQSLDAELARATVREFNAGDPLERVFERALDRVLIMHRITVLDLPRLRDSLYRAVQRQASEYATAHNSYAAAFNATNGGPAVDARARLVQLGLTLRSNEALFAVVRADGAVSVVTPRDVKSGALEPAELRQIKAQLEAMEGPKPAEAINLLGQAINAGSAAARRTLLEHFSLRVPLSQPQPLFVVSNAQAATPEVTDLARLLVPERPDGPQPLLSDRARAESVLMHLEKYAHYMADVLHMPPSEQPFSMLSPRVLALREYLGATQAQSAAKTALPTVQAEKEVKRQALQESVQSGFLDENVRHTLQETLAPLATDSATATMPDASNYVAVDVGLSIAVPTSGGTYEPWLLPYLGLNIYSIAVDRKIPWNQTVGSKLRQRLSLTVGVTLNSAPTIPGRTVTGPVLDRYPLVALGMRLTSFVRVAAGVNFYRLGDVNPASAATTLGVAPFVGLSADIDIISAFVTEIGKFSNIKP